VRPFVPGVYCQRETGQHGPSRHVTEAYMIKHQLTLQLSKRSNSGAVGGFVGSCSTSLSV